MGLNAANIGVLVTIVICVAGVIYKAGQLSARVDALERTVRKFEETLEGFFRRLERITPRKPVGS